MLKRNYRKIGLSAILAGYFILPSLILTGIISFEHKFMALVGYGVMVAVVLRCLGFQWSEVGVSLDKKQIYKSVKTLWPMTASLMLLALVAYFGGIKRFISTETWDFYMFYVLVSSLMQEFLYRAVPTLMGHEFGLRVLPTVVISSLLYAFVHAIYGDVVLILATFPLGLAWHYYYLKTEHLAGVALSHAVFGGLTIWLGLI